MNQKTDFIGVFFFFGPPGKGERQFFKTEGILKKREVKKGEIRASSELRNIVLRKIYSIVM